MKVLQAVIPLFALTTIACVQAAPVPIRLRKASVAFAADESIDVARIYSAVKAAKEKSLATFPSQQDKSSDVHIYGDWLNLSPEVSAFHFIADMDTDCDGKDFKCKGNPDGQSQTSFGALDASKVPYFVIPLSFTEKHKDDLKPNALGAVICNGKMFYGIYGDQNGDDPQVIGEASILMAQTCFPNAGISGDNGHVQEDVAYIVFGNKVPDGVGKSEIDLDALKQLGDEQVKLLQSALNLGGNAKNSKDDS